MKYRVILEVIYPTEVEAENEAEAIELAMQNCPYDNADEVEPVVEEVKEENSIFPKITLPVGSEEKIDETIERIINDLQLSL